MLVTMDGLTKGALSFDQATGVDYPSSSMQKLAMAILLFFPAFALLTVVIRAAARWQARQFDLDDWLICIAMALSIAETAASYFCKLAQSIRPNTANAEQLSRQILSAFMRQTYRQASTLSQGCSGTTSSRSCITRSWRW